MLVVRVDTNEDRICSVLNALGSDGERVLKNAINRTARKARKTTAKEATKRYDYQEKANFLNEMKLKTAKKVAYGNMMAEISAKGSVNEIKQFAVDNLQVARGKNRPDAIKGKVMTASGMTELKRQGIKAFVAQFKSGHISVVAREKLSSSQKSRGHHGGKDYKYASYRLKKLLSPSVPQMLGNKEAINEVVEPEIQDLLVKNVERQFAMLMKKKTKTGTLID